MRNELIPVRTRILRRMESRYRAWRYRTKHDPEEIRWMRSVLAPGDAVVDIGAYKGVYTYWMRREVGSSGRVFAFEPQPELAESLRLVINAFSWANVHVEEAGLSMEPGQRVLHVPGGGGPTPCASLEQLGDDRESRRYQVKVTTLDEFLDARASQDRIRLIKCDVEGHELDVFRGARRTLTDDRPFLLFECEVRHNAGRPLTGIFRYLEDLGYRGSFFWGEERLDVSEFDGPKHQVHGRQPYANNFVFVPSEGSRST